MPALFSGVPARSFVSAACLFGFGAWDKHRYSADAFNPASTRARGTEGHGYNK
jgi:hypothetical protein